MPRRPLPPPPQKSRQRRGSGSVSRHAKSGRWRVNLPTRLDPARKDYYFPSEAEGRDWLTAEILRREQGETIALGGPEQPLWQHLQSWRATKADLAAQSAPSYDLAIRKVQPLWDVPLNQLTHRHFEQLFADWQRAGLAPATIRKHRSILSSAMRWGMPDLLSFNPLARAVPPKGDGGRPAWQPWDAADIERFLNVTDHEPDAAFWRLLLSTGCRPGEARGLQWADLETGRSLLTIQRSLSEKRRGSGRQRGYVVGPTKTKKARVVELDPATLEAFRLHRAAQQPLRVWVFANPQGEPWSARHFVERFRGLRRRAGCAPLHLYGTRHSFATQRLADGVPVMAVSATLGHSNPAVTLKIYARWMPSHQRLSTASVERSMPAFRQESG
jgi:integrase